MPRSVDGPDSHPLGSIISITPSGDWYLRAVFMSIDETSNVAAGVENGVGAPKVGAAALAAVTYRLWGKIMNVFRRRATSGASSRLALLSRSTSRASVANSAEYSTPL